MKASLIQVFAPDAGRPGPLPRRRVALDPPLHPGRVGRALLPGGLPLLRQLRRRAGPQGLQGRGLQERVREGPRRGRGHVGAGRKWEGLLSSYWFFGCFIFMLTEPATINGSAQPFFTLRCHYGNGCRLPFIVIHCINLKFANPCFYIQLPKKTYH